VALQWAPLLLAPMAGADPTSGVTTGPSNNHWGQAVKACNASSCYPGGETRGAFVSGAAQANPNGFATNIHNPSLNANPGNSSFGLAHGNSPFSQ